MDRPEARRPGNPVAEATFMRQLLKVVPVGLLLAFAGSGATLAAASPGPPAIERTVYISITDDDGRPIAGLTPADIVVKEGGKEREIVRAVPATARMRLALAVEDRLIGDRSVRLALFEFVKRVIETADISLLTIGLRQQTVVDYTSNLETFVAGINKLSLDPSRDSNVAESVLDLAKEFTAKKAERGVLVVVSQSGGQSGVDARTVLNAIRDSGITMHAVTLGIRDATPTGAGSLNEQSGREQVLGDGPKQSGGRRVEVAASGAIRTGLQQVADDLLAQYAVTYTLPDGVKPDRRFNASVKRRGVTVRAPSAIPDR
jgi:hypothetical protein